MNFLDTAYKKLVAINIALYLILGLLYLCSVNLNFVMLPSSFGEAVFKPWTLVTYMFSHFAFLHLLFNMTWLFFFGRVLYELCGKKHTVAAYVAAGLAGGICFMAWGSMGQSAEYLIGSSAAVLGLMTATVVVAPDYSLNLLFLGEVKIKWIYAFAVFILLISSPQIFKLQLTSTDIAHLAGIITGGIYGRLYKHPIFKPRRKKIVLTPRENSPDVKTELDSLLDKVRRSGYSSLSESEKTRMIEISNELQKHQL